MNPILSALLKTSIEMLQSSRRPLKSMKEESKDRVRRISNRARQISKPEDHTLRNTVSLVSGVVVGVGIAMLFAPASGDEIRSSLEEKARAIRDRVKERFAGETIPEDESFPDTL